MPLHEIGTTPEGEGRDPTGGLVPNLRSRILGRGGIAGAVVLQPQGGRIRSLRQRQEEIQPAVAAPLGHHQGGAQAGDRLQGNEALAIAPQQQHRTSSRSAAVPPQQGHQGFRLPIAIEIEPVEHVARPALLVAGVTRRPRREQMALKGPFQGRIRKGDRGHRTLYPKDRDRGRRRQLHRRIGRAPTVRCEG